MKNLKYYLIFIVLVSQFHCFAQKTAYDTTFHNTHYDMRQDIYDAMPDKKGEIIFLGNSITERINWSELLGSYKIINRGIGGDNCWGVYNRLDEVLASQPKEIFILIGINDIGRGIPTAVITRKYEQIIKKINSKSPKTKVVLQTVIPIDEESIWYDYMKGKSPEIIELNKEITSLAEKFELEFIDLYAAFTNKNGSLIKEYTIDGLHLNGKGYMHWAKVIRESNIKLK